MYGLDEGVLDSKEAIGINKVLDRGAYVAAGHAYAGVELLDLRGGVWCADMAEEHAVVAKLVDGVQVITKDGNAETRQLPRPALEACAHASRSRARA